MVEEKKRKKQEQEGVILVRILGKDIRGDKKLLSGITQIRGISWAFANAVCKVLKLDRRKRIQEISLQTFAGNSIFNAIQTILISPLLIQNLGNTIQDDTVIISNLNLNLVDQASLISSLRLSVDDLTELIMGLELRLSEEEIGYLEKVI